MTLNDDATDRPLSGIGTKTGTETERRSANRPARSSLRQLLWWLIGGSRGGRNRLRIVRALDDQPMNTNQLANELDLNYKTVQHHLERLEENRVLTTTGGEYGKMYFLSERLKRDIDLLDEVAEEAGIEPDADS